MAVLSAQLGRWTRRLGVINNKDRRGMNHVRVSQIQTGMLAGHHTQAPLNTPPRLISFWEIQCDKNVAAPSGTSLTITSVNDSLTRGSGWG